MWSRLNHYLTQGRSQSQRRQQCGQGHNSPEGLGDTDPLPASARATHKIDANPMAPPETILEMSKLASKIAESFHYERLFS